VTIFDVDKLDSIWVPTLLAVCTIPENFLFLLTGMLPTSWPPDGAADALPDDRS
jgi:hypothetical protein